MIEDMTEEQYAEEFWRAHDDVQQLFQLFDARKANPVVAGIVVIGAVALAIRDYADDMEAFKEVFEKITKTTMKTITAMEGHTDDPTVH